MNLQSYSIHSGRKSQNEESKTSYTKTLSLIAQNRMLHIWITFIDGVKSLCEFDVCLREPIFKSQRLQELSKNAQEKINLAEQDISSGENDIKAEINCVLLKRQKHEQEMEDLNNKIIALSQMTFLKQEEVQRATAQVKTAERQVEIHTKKEDQAQTNNLYATGGSIILSVAAFAITGPIGAIGTAVIGGCTTAVTHSHLQNARKAVTEKMVELKERENDLRELETTLHRINSENSELKIDFDNLEICHENLLHELKQLTMLKSWISQFHDYISIALGRVDILNERRKVEIFRGNLKQIIEKIVEHLSDVQFLEGHFPILQQLKSLKLEMQSICIEPISNAEQIEDDMKTSCYTKCCNCSYCCIDILFSSIRCLFCCFRSFRL